MRSSPLGKMPEPMDWQALVRLGVGRLGVAPDVFWSMTPWELRLALEGAGLVRVTGSGPGRMSRETLAAMMAQHPDTAGQED